MHKGVNTTMDEGQTMVPVAFKASHFTRGKDGAPVDVALPLSADADKGDQDQLICAPIAASLTAGGANVNGKGGYAGRRQEDEVNLVAFNARQDPVTSQYTTGALDSDGTSQAVAFQPRFARNGRGMPIEGVAYPLTAEAGRTGKGDSAQVVATGWSVRRLMPVECERLQGVPDGFTAIPYRGKPAADGPRYKVLGNMQSVNVVRWIGTRIKMVETIR
jgi:DNA (cytosine-5)-methyltransferase 1